MPTIDEGEEPVEININPEKVAFIIIKAREFDGKVDAVIPDSASNAADDGERDILGDYAGDATLEELRGAIDILDDDEIIDLIALAWVGRGDFGRADWAEARALASERHRAHSANYLIGMPALGDYLEEGLSELGHSTADVDTDDL